MPLSNRVPITRRLQLDRADRLQRMPMRADAELDRIAERLRHRGVQVIDLAQRIVPDAEMVSRFNATLSGAGSEPVLHTDTQALREQLAAWYQARFDVALSPDHEIEVVPNIELAASLVALAFVDAGDMALLPDPGPMSFRRGVILAGGGVIPYPLLERNDYLPNFVALENGLAGRLRLMVLLYPNDPTTVIGDLSVFNQAVAFAKQNNVLLVSDASHAHGISGPTQPRSLLEVPAARGVGVEFWPLDAPLGLPQLPLTVVAGNRDVVSALKFLSEAGHLEPSRPAVEITQTLLHNAEPTLRDRLQRLDASRQVLVDALTEIGWRPRSSATVPYVWASVPTVVDNVSFCRRLLRRTGVRVRPGTAFGERGEGFMRISIPPDETLAKAVAERLRSHARLYQRRLPRGRRLRAQTRRDQSAKDNA